MLESDDCTLIYTNDGRRFPTSISESILHFTEQLEWEQWYAVVISDRFIIAGEIKGPLS